MYKDIIGMFIRGQKRGKEMVLPCSKKFRQNLKKAGLNIDCIKIAIKQLNVEMNVEAQGFSGVKVSNGLYIIHGLYVFPEKYHCLSVSISCLAF